LNGAGNALVAINRAVLIGKRTWVALHTQWDVIRTLSHMFYNVCTTSVTYVEAVTASLFWCSSANGAVGAESLASQDLKSSLGTVCGRGLPRLLGKLAFGAQYTLYAVCVSISALRAVGANTTAGNGHFARQATGACNCAVIRTERQSSAISARIGAWFVCEFSLGTRFARGETRRISKRP